MNNKFIVTFDKSQEDIPTLIVAEEKVLAFNPSIYVKNIITGEDAEFLWKTLRGIRKKDNT